MTPSVAIIGTRGYPSFYGGFETAVRHIAPYLADAGWDVTVYGREGSTRPDAQGRDDRVRSLKTRGLETKSLSTLSYGFTASAHAFRKKPDVALVMNVANGFYLPALRARGIPTLVNVDGIEWDRDKWGRLAKFMFRAGAKTTAQFADSLVFDSLEIGRRWEADFGRTGVFIPYGGQEAPELPIEPGLISRGYILVVARFVPENTISEFLDAAADLAKNWPVVIVGSSGYEGELDRQADTLQNSNSNVRWLGHVSDDQRLHSLWQHCGVYFHGHSVGGTNPALVQAMALGAPTVARDTPYNREVLGTGGTFTGPKPAEIVESISSLMRNRASQEVAIASGLERARTQYTWGLVCSRYLSELERLARK
jgi:glycosyltransferase involved in cell wall biosynthesis